MRPRLQYTLNYIAPDDSVLQGIIKTVKAFGITAKLDADGRRTDVIWYPIG